MTAWTWGTAKTHGLKNDDRYLHGGYDRRKPGEPEERIYWVNNTHTSVGGVARRFWAAPVEPVVEVATPDLGAATGDALAVLRLLVDGKVDNPTDVTEEIGSVNHRYARELLGLLRTQGYADQVEMPQSGNLVWIATEQGSALARQTVACLNGSSTETTGHSPEEHQMPTKTRKTKQAPKASTPSAPRFCGCGCDEQLNGKSQFRQGHDARMVSQNAASVTSESQIATLYARIAKDYSEALALKFDSAARNRLAKANAPKRERAPRKSTSKPKTVEAKVGRWTKTGHLTAEGDLITTNAKGQEQVIAKGKFQLIK